MKFDEMLKDPASVFDSPTQVLEAQELSREQKIKILRRWEDDARLLLTAQSEGMQGENRAEDTMKAVQAALDSLGAEASDT